LASEAAFFLLVDLSRDPFARLVISLPHNVATRMLPLAAHFERNAGADVALSHKSFFCLKLEGIDVDLIGGHRLCCVGFI
jgi:hypothetical protein